MVVPKVVWLVALGISLGGVDSFLCEYHYEEFFDCVFNAFDDLRRAFCVRVHSPAGSVLETQFFLRNAIRSVEPSLHLREVRHGEPTRFS